MSEEKTSLPEKEQNKNSEPNTLNSANEDKKIPEGSLKDKNAITDNKTAEQNHSQDSLKEEPKNSEIINKDHGEQYPEDEGYASESGKNETENISEKLPENKKKEEKERKDDSGQVPEEGSDGHGDDKKPASVDDKTDSNQSSEVKQDEQEQKEDDREDDDEDDDDDDDDIEEADEKIDGLSREELVALLEETVKETDISKIKTKVALIKVAYLKATKEDQHQQLEKSIGEEEKEAVGEADQLEERYNLAFSVYRQNKSAYLQEQEKRKEKNLEEKLRILEELKELINSEETLKKTYDEFKNLQERWKEIGMVPRTEVNNLWQSYHFLVEKFFDKVKINKELRDLDLKKNLESKIELCEKAEELLLETSIIKSFKELQKLHEKYKEIGPVPIDKKDEVWERFKLATDKINERRREHYSQLSEQQNKNLEAKTALCEKAEEFLTIKNNSMKDWQETTNQVNELFKVWRTIGPATKKYNDEIWNRFKSSLNTFFENRREFFGKVKEQQLNNYNLKLDLCVQAEALQDSTDWKSTTDDLIKLQKDWRKIGPVPRKYSDKIWKRFRAANDHFFNRKAEYFSNIHEHENKNLEEKRALTEKVKNFEFGKDKSENLKVIKDFQRKWMEIGHVPIKEKDKVQKEFRDAIDSQLEKLKISSVEINTLNFKTKIDAIKDDKNSRRTLSKERNFLNNKINKLREDIHLWENNVGFLANSKKADVLKEEFNKKIEKAKQDLKVMEAKLRYLDSQRG